MSELDVLLRESLGRLAEPGDPTGVVEAVRARVEAAGSGGGNSAGDGGSGATGAGGAAATGSGFWGGWAPLGILIGLSVAGGAGLALAMQSDAAGTGDYTPLSLPADYGVPAASCPGGETVAVLDPGARVVAVARTEDGGSVAVRDPRNLDSLVWIALSAAEPDAGSDIDALPVSGCEESGPIVPIVTAEPEPVPTETDEPAPGPGPGPAPQPGPGPQPPADTQAPTIQVGSFSPSEFHDQANTLNCAELSDISVFVADNVGVTAVNRSVSHGGISVSPNGQSGNTWNFRATASGLAGSFNNVVTVTFTAVDAAGNSSAPANATVRVYGPGWCVE